jgi:hypothetical protein
MARAQDENFSVADRLLGRRLRGHLLAVYRFASDRPAGERSCMRPPKSAVARRRRAVATPCGVRIAQSRYRRRSARLHAEIALCGSGEPNCSSLHKADRSQSAQNELGRMTACGRRLLSPPLLFRLPKPFGRMPTTQPHTEPRRRSIGAGPVDPVPRAHTTVRRSLDADRSGHASATCPACDGTLSRQVL